ncbi:MAG: type II toxin-antitoxin system VapC family toxin [Thermoguttaceae bacterium]
MSRYVIDTNVILRSVADVSVQHSSAVSVIALLLEKEQELFLAPQVLMEFWAVVTRPVAVNGFDWSVEEARGEISRLLDQFSLLPETPAVFEEWLRLVTKQKVIGKQAHDARLAALLNTHGIAHLLTFNVNDFKNYGIKAVSPDEILAQ